MGLSIEREEFSEDEHEAFGRRLARELELLRDVIARPGFGAGPVSLGAELELNLVDGDLRPLFKNQEVLARLGGDPEVTLEIDRFNLEINTPPTLAAGRPFAALGESLRSRLAAIGTAAGGENGRVAMIGILPTLTLADLGTHAVSDAPRYRALGKSLLTLGGSFAIDIQGEDALSVRMDHIATEGANTSFQVHVKTPADRFADVYNAAQLATAPVLAIAGNSPTFLGKRLWDETRIALFRQSVDDRPGAQQDDWRPARVSFGHGWVRRGAHELFSECVHMHRALLPVSGRDSGQELHSNEAPELAELRLHNGTVWRWNRPVYDPVAGGHLRVELRALPAGPTVIDMMANAAFAVGLVHGLAPRIEEHLCRLTFGQARRNFYEAARLGPRAELLWPTWVGPSPSLRPAQELVIDLLPVARAGLGSIGVQHDECERLLGVIERRAMTGRTGSAWQRRTYDALRARLGDSSALRAMLGEYLTRSESDAPVAEWSDVATG